MDEIPCDGSGVCDEAQALPSEAAGPSQQLFEARSDLHSIQRSANRPAFFPSLSWMVPLRVRPSTLPLSRRVAPPKDAEKVRTPLSYEMLSRAISPEIWPDRVVRVPVRPEPAV